MLTLLCCGVVVCVVLLCGAESPGMRDSGRVYAMKVLAKVSVIKRNQVEHTLTERSVLEYIRHPYIVALRYAFQTRTKLYFILDWCPGGELFFHLGRAGRFSENRAKFYAAQIILALEHLHAHSVIYRDLKVRTRTHAHTHRARTLCQRSTLTFC